MLAHLIIGTIVGLIAAVTMAAAGGGALSVVLVYSAMGMVGLMGSASIAMMREDRLSAEL